MISPRQRRKPPAHHVHAVTDRQSIDINQHSEADRETVHHHHHHPPTQFTFDKVHKPTLSKRHYLCSVALFIVALVMLLCHDQYSAGIETLPTLRETTQPFSSLDSHSNLIGQYSLDGDTAITSSLSGMVYFPSRDLISYINEDATNIKLLQQQLLSVGKNNNTSDYLFHDIHESLHHESKEVDDNDHALLTLKGYKGSTPNQDRSMIIKFMLGNQSNTNTTTTTNSGGGVTNKKQGQSNAMAVLMGIFDGHGDKGHEVSQHVALELPKVFVKHIMQQQHQITPTDLNYPDMIRQIMKITFLEIDNSEPLKGSGISGGSTASTFFYPGRGSNFYLANVGDSTTIIAHYSTSTRIATIAAQNRKDKPNLKEERERIEKAGGRVYIPFIAATNKENNNYGPQDSSRLLITLPDGSQLGLAMSRSIGDAEGKPFGLVAYPTVEVFDIQSYYLEKKYSQDQINDSEWFVIVASDGVYDVIPQENVVQRIGDSLYRKDGGGGVTFVEKTCEQIVREAG
eukprot:scaffold100848_cov37-Cyclotella_meneghiniana.AAC.1